MNELTKAPIEKPWDKPDIQKEYPLAWALEKALGIQALLLSHCENNFCDIVGSIRREKPYVHDIEILCVPKTTTEEEQDLFGEKEVRTGGFITTMNTWQILSGDPIEGRHIKCLHVTGIKIDIFIVKKDNWGVQKVIRTGPAGYSKRMMETARAKAHKIADGGYLFKYIKEGQWERIPCYSENEFYEALKMNYTKPKFRI